MIPDAHTPGAASLATTSRRIFWRLGARHWAVKTLPVSLGLAVKASLSQFQSVRLQVASSPSRSGRVLTSRKQRDVLSIGAELNNWDV